MRKRYLVHCVAIASVVFISGVLGGCAKKTVMTEESMSSAAQESQPEPAPAPQPEYKPGSEESLDNQVMGKKMMKPEYLEGRTSAPMLPVYFDFDKSTIRKDQTTRMIGNADFLKSNPRMSVRVEGNCDERGTNEYNLALGERRAMSAKNYLVNLGIPASRITTISYGEERPLNHGHDELAWSQNRRGDFAIVE